MGREAIYAFQAYVVQVSWVSLVSGLKGLTNENFFGIEFTCTYLIFIIYNIIIIKDYIYNNNQNIIA